jgi:putative copper resistance protein D
MPPFDLAGGPWLSLARAGTTAGFFSVLGAVVFRYAVAPPALARMDRTERAAQQRRWLILLWAGMGAGCGSGLVWLLLTSADMVDASGLGEALGAVPTVVLNSRFGLILVVRLGLLAVVPVVQGGQCGRWRGGGAVLLAGVATALHAAQGHAASMADGFDGLVLSVVLHLLAAGIWLGQLPPLLLLVRAAPPAVAAMALRRFTPLGLACVAVLAVTASVQGGTLVGGFSGFAGTAYGWAAGVKILLFAVLLGLAAAHRSVFLPRLAGASAEATRRGLCRSLLAEILVGALVIVAASVLASLPPGLSA